MKLTKGFELGVCIMAVLATQEEGIPVGSSIIHSRLGSSLTYTKKLIRKLVVADLAKSVSGNNGGFSLARPAKEITVLNVVEALEGTIDTFPNTGLLNRTLQANDTTAVETADAVIHQVFHEADRRWQDFLNTVTVGDIVQDVLGRDHLPTINWNESSEIRELLIQKVLRGRNGHDKKGISKN